MNAQKLAMNLVTAFFIVLLLLSAIVILAPFAGWRMDTVLSGSMSPAIPVGSMVLLGPVSASQVQVGDIIAYSHGNAEVCHRVIAIDQGPPLLFTTKGDANKSPDSTQVTAGDLSGRLVLTIPFAGYIIWFIKTPPGLFLTIVIPLLFILGTELKALLFDEKEDDAPRRSD